MISDPSRVQSVHELQGGGNKELVPASDLQLIIDLLNRWHLHLQQNGLNYGPS